MQFFAPSEAEQLLPLTQQNLRDMRRDGVLPVGEDRGNRIVYSWADVLCIEAAHQLNADGLSWKRAFQVVQGSGGAWEYLARPDQDFWLAEIGSFHEAGGESYELVGGSLKHVIDRAAAFRKEGDVFFPDAPSRIFMTSLSAADRRVRARARQAKIALES